MSALKWIFYKLLLQVIGDKSPLNTIHYPSNYIPQHQRFQWVFCTTIGELNACKPLIKKIEQQGPLVLITDRDCYQEAYQAHFPNAIIVQLVGSNNEAIELYRHLPCSNLFICEAPCLPNDAPCRLGYPFLKQAKELGAMLYLVNGWIYGYQPSCRQDKIERSLFTQEYINLFDKVMVQTEAVKTNLLKKGLEPNKVFVTGNMKFDALNDTSFSIKDDISKKIIETFSNNETTVLVAGSVSQEWEYALLLESFKALYQDNNGMRLVIAPRHPEKKEQLDIIKNIIEKLTLTYAFKSTLTQPITDDIQVLILDTFGELRSYYACANISYIGKNHNVLEPLTFSKPVVTLAGWEESYPSYPVYEIVTQSDLLFVAENPQDLLPKLKQTLSLETKSYQALLSRKLDGLATAYHKNCSIIFK